MPRDQQVLRLLSRDRQVLLVPRQQLLVQLDLLDLLVLLVQRDQQEQRVLHRRLRVQLVRQGRRERRQRLQDLLGHKVSKEFKVCRESRA